MLKTQQVFHFVAFRLPQAVFITLVILLTLHQRYQSVVKFLFFGFSKNSGTNLLTVFKSRLHALFMPIQVGAFKVSVVNTSLNCYYSY